MHFDNKLRRVYRPPQAPTEVRRDEDGVEWTKLAELDVTTGRWTRYGDYKPFNQSPLDRWEPRGPF